MVHLNIRKRHLAFFLAMLASLAICWISVGVLGLSTFFIFVLTYIFSIIFYMPKYVLSPINVLMGYYGLWFVIGPYFASGYSAELLDSYEYRQSIAYVCTTYLISLYALIYGIKLSERVNYSDIKMDFESSKANLLLVVLYVVSSLMVFLIVINSGGFSLWLKDPGEAFLNRGGTGVYVIASHFSSISFSIVVRLLCSSKKKQAYIGSVF